MNSQTKIRFSRFAQAALAGLLACLTLPAQALGPERDPEDAAERAARTQERATRDAADLAERSDRDSQDTADRTARIEQRFAEDRAKALEEAVRDPEKAAEELAKAEEDRQRELTKLAESETDDNSGSGSGSSGDDDGDDDSNSGSGSGHDDEGGSSSAMRGVAREEQPDFDPRGFPVRRGEVVALDLGEKGLAKAAAAGFRVIARERLETLDGTVTRLDTPDGITPEAALQKLREIDRKATFDYTHYYGMQLTPQGANGVRSKDKPVRLPGNFTIGMIDTGVSAHPALADTAITQRRFGTGPGAKPQFGHGTAVASILANQGSRRLLVADIFRGTPSAPFTSADAIAQSLEWMAGNGISVVNISLAGPRNAILDRLIERATSRGMVVVAAAGNGGPTAPPAYPAALGPVVAVTAVDNQSRIYRYANRGNYIAVAARGVGVPAASAAGGMARFSGTSFATPHIAAWIARCLKADGKNASQCRERLRLSARDVGAPGRDPVYGWGIVETF